MFNVCGALVGTACMLMYRDSESLKEYSSPWIHYRLGEVYIRDILRILLKTWTRSRVRVSRLLLLLRFLSLLWLRSKRSIREDYLSKWVTSRAVSMRWRGTAIKVELGEVSSTVWAPISYASIRVWRGGVRWGWWRWWWCWCWRWGNVSHDFSEGAVVRCLESVCSCEKTFYELLLKLDRRVGIYDQYIFLEGSMVTSKETSWSEKDPLSFFSESSGTNIA